MTANMGDTDRYIRIAVGAGLIMWWLLSGQVWAAIGVVPLATALFRFCPAYKILGMSTSAPKQE